MKNILRPILFGLLLSFGLFLAEARADEKPWTEQFLSEFAEVKTRLASVEKQQEDIAAKDNLILEKLDQLRIWVHRK